MNKEQTNVGNDGFEFDHNSTCPPETYATAVDWLLSEIKRRVDIIQSEPQTMAREMLIDNLMVDLEKAREIENNGLNRLNEYWADSREQAVQIAKRIGFRKGVEMGLLNAEDYWIEYEAFQDGNIFKDDTEFNNDYINKLWYKF